MSSVTVGASITANSNSVTGEMFDLDCLMNKLMLMRAINRPSITDVMVAAIGQEWQGTKPNGTPWTIRKVDENSCELVIAA